MKVNKVVGRSLSRAYVLETFTSSTFSQSPPRALREEVVVQ